MRPKNLGICSTGKGSKARTRRSLGWAGGIPGNINAQGGLLSAAKEARGKHPKKGKRKKKREDQEIRGASKAKDKWVRWARFQNNGEGG